MHYDVFNGDADGICALIQLRLAQPKNTQLITGVKRDIQLLLQVPIEHADSVTVLDISLAKNRTALDNLLAKGVSVLYIDHHQTGDIPQHSQLTMRLNTNAQVCTALLVNEYLQSYAPTWAIVGAFGDNLLASARDAAQLLGLTESQSTQLQQLGTYINYNAYGDSIADLHRPPSQLYQQLVNYRSPLAFIMDRPDCFAQLQQAYFDDLIQAQQVTPEWFDAAISIVILPDTAWAKRVSGVYGNYLANQYPQRAHAVLRPVTAQIYQVSVRAPVQNPYGADQVCAQFATGGGRAAAAGINQLPLAQLSAFISTMQRFFQI